MIISGYYENVVSYGDVRCSCFTIDDDYYQDWVDYENEKDDSNECSHVWKHYQGLNESYEYCEKCNKKRDEV